MYPIILRHLLWKRTFLYRPLTIHELSGGAGTLFVAFDHKPLALVSLANTHSESSCQKQQDTLVDDNCTRDAHFVPGTRTDVRRRRKTTIVEDYHLQPQIL